MPNFTPCVRDDDPDFPREARGGQLWTHSTEADIFTFVRDGHWYPGDDCDTDDIIAGTLLEWAAALEIGESA